MVMSGFLHCWHLPSSSLTSASFSSLQLSRISLFAHGSSSSKVSPTSWYPSFGSYCFFVFVLVRVVMLSFCLCAIYCRFCVAVCFRSIVNYQELAREPFQITVPRIEHALELSKLFAGFSSHVGYNAL